MIHQKVADIVVRANIDVGPFNLVEFSNKISGTKGPYRVLLLGGSGTFLEKYP